jgi:formylglycine-generating enzyme required for sulfatase activity
MPQKLAVRTQLNRLAMAIALAASSAAFAQPTAQSPRVDLGDFKIDLTEVSIGRFAEYAKRKGIVTEAERSGGGFEYVMGWQKRKGWNWRTPFGEPAQADEPAVQVKWSEARAFCQDAGGD